MREEPKIETVKDAVATTDDILEPREWKWSWLPNFWWNRSPPELLRDMESKFFTGPTVPASEGFYVEFPGDFFEDCQQKCRVWTRKIRCQDESRTLDSSAAPLVMIHGMGAGGAFFAINIGELSKYFDIYLVDLPGFARSSRNVFSRDPTKCETQYVEAIDRWRQTLRIDQMHLLGHSFGGYLVTSYSMTHPEHIKHLLLADPWGILPMPPDVLSNFRYPKLASAIFSIYVHFNPLAMLRLFGRFAFKLIRSVRMDLAENMSPIFADPEENCTSDYIVHTTFHNPTGESAFHTLMHNFAWAKRPMIDRIGNLDPKIPLTAIYGEDSWMRKVSTDQLREARGYQGYNLACSIPDARHHVYARYHDFNKAIITNIKRAMMSRISSKSDPATPIPLPDNQQ